MSGSRFIPEDLILLAFTQLGYTIVEFDETRGIYLFIHEQVPSQEIPLDLGMGGMPWEDLARRLDEEGIDQNAVYALIEEHLV